MPYKIRIPIPHNQPSQGSALREWWEKDIHFLGQKPPSRDSVVSVKELKLELRVMDAAWDTTGGKACQVYTLDNAPKGTFLRLPQDAAMEKLGFKKCWN